MFNYLSTYVLFEKPPLQKRQFATDSPPPLNGANDVECVYQGPRVKVQSVALKT